MSARRSLALVGVPVLLAAVCGLFCFFSPVRVETSLDGLVGTSGRTIPPAIRARSAALVPVIVSSREAAKARRAADALEKAFREVVTEGKTVEAFCSEIRYRQTGEDVGRFMDYCRTHRSGLVAPAAAEKLKTREGRASLARAALRRYYSSPVPPLFAPADDPFCLLDGFVTSLPTSFSGWFPKDGVLTAEREGVTHLLMLLELEDFIPKELDSLMKFRRCLEAARASVAEDPSVAVAACGAPLHTAISADACRREIGWLTWFSLAFIAALSVVAFRSVRWIPLLALSLGSSVLAGLAAVLAVFGELHLMTIVIGTTVLGLVIDYSFHWLLHGSGERRGTTRNLLVSFVTTEISLLPLLLSSIPILRQASVFLGAGLAAALGYVVWCYPRTVFSARTDREECTFGWTRAVSLGLAAIALFGLRQVRFGAEMTAVYRPPAELVAPERLFAELNGGTDADRGFVVTEGGDLEALLEKESALGLPAETPCLSRFLPPLEVRRQIAGEVAKLYAEQGAKQAKALGIGMPVPPPEPVAWRTEDLPRELRRTFIGGGTALIVPAAPRPTGVLPEGVVFCQPRETIAEVLSGWGREALVLLGVSLGLMFVVLACCLRRRALAAFGPSLFALLAVAGLLGLLDVKINLFHLLAGFLLAGMSVDYTVFLHAGKSLKPAFCSLLTSLAGFGALVFVSFPVVRSFGLVLGTGLPVAFVAALATMPRTGGVEKAASPLGLEILWIFYRLFGLRVLHLGASCVGLCAWLFSRGVRRASPSVRKVINFTRSLADKLVVMAEGADLPRVVTDGSADAEAFLADVRCGRGVFVLSSHCGTVETLVALGACTATFHAWMDFDRTSVFNRFYLRHVRRPRVQIHPISEIGMETAFFAADAIERGDSLVMAGDRGRGAFRFAHAVGAPTYFIACVWTGSGYRAIVRRLPDETKAMERRYGEVLGEVTAEFADQWFVWEGESK